MVADFAENIYDERIKMGFVLSSEVAPMTRLTALAVQFCFAALILNGAARCAPAQDVAVKLTPLDEIGDQIEVFQFYYQSLEDPSVMQLQRLAYGIFDTGAMMSLISTQTAAALGLKEENHTHKMDLAGASGTPQPPNLRSPPCRKSSNAETFWN
jgi:hypothetical protein